MLEGIANDTERDYTIVRADIVLANTAVAYVAADGSAHEVRIDFSGIEAEVLYIGDNGVATNMTAEAALAHELAHIYFGTLTNAIDDPKLSDGLSVLLNPETMAGTPVGIENLVH